MCLFNGSQSLSSTCLVSRELLVVFDTRSIEHEEMKQVVRSNIQMLSLYVFSRDSFVKQSRIMMSRKRW